MFVRVARWVQNGVVVLALKVTSNQCRYDVSAVAQSRHDYRRITERISFHGVLAPLISILFDLRMNSQVSASITSN